MILPIGQRERFQMPFQNGFLRLKESVGLKFYHVKSYSWSLFPTGVNVELPLEYEGLMSIMPDDYGNNYAVIEHLDNNDAVINEFKFDVKTPSIELNIDSNRDGNVDSSDNGKANWVWGKYQNGAIVAVNNDRDTSDFPSESNENSEFGVLEFKPALIDDLDRSSIILYCTENASSKFRIYGKSSNTNEYEIILGKGLDGNTIQFSRHLNLDGEVLFIEALEFPNSFFEGLITIEAGLFENNSFNSFDKVVYRTAPWIMTPNTLEAEEVFVCKITAEDESVNDKFIDGLKSALDELNIPLTIIPPKLHNNDRWIQDEVEFGYSQTPTHTLPVVFDSPRDRGLDGFPEAKLLSSDFGHFQIGGSTPNSLDSFGNLEVSPPVTVNGKHYPFGRIIFGGRKYGNYSTNSRQMMPEVRKFLYAQKIQAPVELFSDWLSVGHVDEYICFVPSDNSKGFKLLIASPMRAKAILDRLKYEGHGNEVLFKGKMREFEGSGISAEVEISTLLSNANFWEANFRYQEIINFNQQILEQELGLTDNEIVQIPVLFHPMPEDSRTAAYFPDMVNHLVIGKSSIVPKPYGPIINGECAFEKAMKEALPDRKFYFIDDWYSYHEMLGEVHCGTNTRRKPFDSKTWWEFLPDGGFNI